MHCLLVSRGMQLVPYCALLIFFPFHTVTYLFFLNSYFYSFTKCYLFWEITLCWSFSCSRCWELWTISKKALREWSDLGVWAVWAEKHHGFKWSSWSIVATLPEINWFKHIKCHCFDHYILKIPLEHPWNIRAAIEHLLLTPYWVTMTLKGSRENRKWEREKKSC